MMFKLRTMLKQKILLTFFLTLFASRMVDAREFFVDLGSSRNPTAGWNNLTSGRAGDGLENLKDSSGNVSTLSIKVTDSFWQQSPGMANSGGTSESKLFPPSATVDSFFVGHYDGYTDETAKLQISGLNDQGAYTLRLYASRMSARTIDRTTVFTVNGESRELQVRNNIDNLAEFSNLKPNHGVLEITVARKQGALFGYLGVIDLVENSNLSPTANAGIDKTTSMPRNYVTLSGTGTDPDGSIASYHWSKVSGGTANIVTPSSATTTINNLAEGSYTFRLKVTDDKGASDSDDVVVTVKKVDEVWVAGGKTIVLPKTSSIYLPDLSSYNIKPGDTIVIPAGTYTGITLGHFHGSSTAPVKIVNASGGKVVSPYLRVANATCFSVSGTGSSDTYGFVLGSTASNASFGTGEGVSDFELQHVEAKDSTCGFFIKVNPSSDRPLTIYPNWVMDNIEVHHNYLHNIHGEGMYIGHTGGNGGQGSNPLIPIRLNHVKIHDNLVENTDWDGIQLSTAREGAEIYHNIVRHYGLTNKATQQAGIILGGATTGKIYDNRIEDGTGNGIEYFGYGKGEVTGNILINAGTLLTSDTIFINQVLNKVEQDPALSILVDSNKIVNAGRTPVRNGNYYHLEAPGRITNNLIWDSSNFDALNPLVHSNAKDFISNNLLNPPNIARPALSN